MALTLNSLFPIYEMLITILGTHACQSNPTFRLNGKSSFTMRWTVLFPVFTWTLRPQYTLPIKTRRGWHLHRPILQLLCWWRSFVVKVMFYFCTIRDSVPFTIGLIVVEPLVCSKGFITQKLATVGTKPLISTDTFPIWRRQHNAIKSTLGAITGRNFQTTFAHVTYFWMKYNWPLPRNFGQHNTPWPVASCVWEKFCP